MVVTYLAALLHPCIYWQGRREAGGTIGMTYGHPYTLRSRAYDLGRWHGKKV